MRHATNAGLALLTASALGCGTDVAVFTPGGAGGVGGEGGASNTGGGSTTAGGAGGEGGATTTFCNPGDEQPCYSGPAMTQGVGTCVPGTEICEDDGQSYGPCVGEVVPQAEDCATTLDEDCDGAALPCVATHIWGRHIGDAIPEDVFADAAGATAITGMIDGNANFGNGMLSGYQDVFVAKYDAAGALQFANTFGDNSFEVGMGVAIDPNGAVLIAGHFNDSINFGGTTLTSAQLFTEDIFVAKFDAAGAHVWSKRFGDEADQRAVRVQVDNLGNVYLAGRFMGSVSFGGTPLSSTGEWDVFVAKLDPQGNHLWSKAFGDANTQMLSDLDVSPAGAIAVSGYFIGTVSFGGALLVNTTGSSDTYLARLGPDGQHVWSQRYGEGADEAAMSVAVIGSGGVVATGFHQGMIDFGGGPLSATGTNAFSAAFGPAGQHLWSQTHGAGALQEGTGIACDGNGSPIFVGNFESTIGFGTAMLQSAGAEDIFVAKLSSTGTHIWSDKFGDASLQRVAALDIDGADQLVMAGYFQGTLQIGSNSWNANGLDGYVAKIAPPP